MMIILAAHTSPSIWNIIIVIAALWWTSTARVVRSRVLQLREMPSVEAARGLGAGDGYIVFVHILPKYFAGNHGQVHPSRCRAMLTEVSLSFLG
ncbi:MAG: ABC transporter permease subunit [Methanothrix sp.]|nr:ABC transporter permease subunit [Methanothrix sp.]